MNISLPNGAPPPDPAWLREKLISLDLEEFKALHAQILERSRVQQRTLGIAATLSVAVLAFLGFRVFGEARLTQFDYGFALSLVLLPLPFCALTLYYGLQDSLIAATATYLDTALRSSLVSKLGTADFWLNEAAFRQARGRRNWAMTEWLSSFGLLLFTPVALMAISARYLLAHLLVLEKDPPYLILALWLTSVLVTVLAAVDSLRGAKALAAIGSAPGRIASSRRPVT
jgi:hypothetical protein